MSRSIPYLRLIATVGVLIGTWPLSSLFANPADLSIEAHKRWKEAAKARVEKQVKEQFADREAAMEAMSTPFKIGEEVTVTIQQGARLRKITGKFKDFDGFRAHIGETEYLLGDLAKVDADRVRFGKHPELLQLTLEQMRRELELEKSKVRQVSLKRLANEAGYTEKFLESSAELGGRYWPYTKLGEGKLKILVNVNPNEPFVEVLALNESGTSCTTVFILGKEAVSATLRSDGKSIPEYVESVWSRHRFRLQRGDLGDDPIAYIAKNLRLWTVRNETGSWQFTCSRPQVQGSRASIDLEMPRLRVKHHSPANTKNMSRFSVAAARYQLNIEAVIEEERAKLEADRAAAEAKAKAEAEELERRKNERIAATKRRKEAESNYIWLTADQAKELNAGGQIDRQILTSGTFDDINYPTQTTIDDTKYQILRFTDWEKRNAATPERDRLALCEVVSMKFRIMRLMYADTYKRKMAKLQAEKAALLATPEQPATPGGIDPRTALPPEAYDEFGPGGPDGFSPQRPGGVARQTAEDVVDEGTSEFLEKLQEIDEEDEKDERPDPGYLVQYRASFQNTLSESVEYVATITVGFGEGEELVWTDTYTPIPQYLGPIYGNKVISIEDLKRGVKKIKLEGKVTGGEELRKKREELLKTAIKNQPKGPITPSNSGSGKKPKPAGGLFD